MILENMSKKKRNRKRYIRRRNKTFGKDVHDGKKVKKLNKFHENDLSEITL
jgi:hypothetical protein